jgi:O-antigen ligase
LATVYRVIGLSRSEFRVSIIDLALVVFMLLALANIWLLSGNPVRMSVAFYDKVFIPISLYWLIRVIEPRANELKALLWVFLWLVFLQFTVAALSWVAPSVVPAAWLGRAGERAVGTVGGPGPYTVTLMVGGLLAVAYLPQVRSTLGRMALYGVMVATFVGVAISLSRGSWLGAALVFIGLAIFYRGMTTRLLAVLAVLMAVLIVAPGSPLSLATERLGDVDTAESRLLTNNAAVRMIQERPLMGFGYGNFEFYDESYKVRLGDIPVEEGSAHQTYLALAAENGVPALLLYMFPALFLLWLTVTRWRDISERHPMHARLIVVLWLALVHQFTVTSFMDMLHSTPWGTAMWWLCLGLIHVLISQASRPQQYIRVNWTVPAALRGAEAPQPAPAAVLAASEQTSAGGDRVQRVLPAK